MWVCDGPRLHRYDPASLQAVTTVELGVPCGQVFATTDLVVAWSYNEEPGESGSSAAAFVDPTTDTLLATTPLPVDVGVPVVLDERVFFPGHLGPVAVVVDREDWAVTDTPDYGRTMGSSQTAFDGSSIYAIVDKQDVLVIDPQTYAVRSTIEPFDLALGATDVNSVAFGLDAIWTVNDSAGVLQRFDLPSG